MNDVNRLKILQDVIDRRLTTRLAASRLEISDRLCRRLLERYREHPFITYDRLGELDQGAIVDNKRLGRALEMIKLVQDKRDNTRSQALPSLDGQTSSRKKQPGKKSQRSLNQDDMLEALQQLRTRSEEIFGKG